MQGLGPPPRGPVVSLKLSSLVSLSERDASGQSNSHISFQLFKALSSVWEGLHHLGKNWGSIQDMPWELCAPQHL